MIKGFPAPDGKITVWTDDAVFLTAALVLPFILEPETLPAFLAWLQVHQPAMGRAEEYLADDLRTVLAAAEKRILGRSA